MDRKRYSPPVRRRREPLMDVLDMKEEVVVVAELPDVRKDEIELYETGDVLTISVDKPQREYLQEIEMPAKVNVKEAKVSYKNRVLEVILPKIEEKL